MVEIESQEKWDEIKTIIDNDPARQPELYSEGYWIGATDKAVEGSWLWVTSGRSVTSWAISQFVLEAVWSPNGPYENCAVLTMDIIYMRAWNCEASKPVICEIGENNL